MNICARRFCLSSIAVATLLLGAPTVAMAGRPLTVDDANVNDKGAGHVELWMARSSDAPGTTVYNLAPAYAPVEGLEIGALLSHETASSSNVSALQAKWRITDSKNKGCNFGAVLGLGRAPLDVNTTYLVGLFTCNADSVGSAHINLGGYQTSGVNGTTHTWGLAFEKPVSGVTPHIEWFGQEGSAPTSQIGLRGQLNKTLQLDGTLGRAGNATLYTLGLKVQF